MRFAVVYRGCADAKRWTNRLNISSACSLQSYLGWNNRKTLWCFCETHLCNSRPIATFHDVAPLLDALQLNQSDALMRKIYPNPPEKRAKNSTGSAAQTTGSDDVMSITNYTSTAEDLADEKDGYSLVINMTLNTKLSADSFSKDQIFFPEAAIAETRDYDVIREWKTT